MTTITIERIKAALSALKPEVKKPWVTLDHLPYIHATDDPDAKPYSTPVVGRFDYLESADYIMACNPAAMAEVLAHIDAQAAEIARLRSESEERLQNCAALVAEVERLRKDAERYQWLAEYLVSDDESYDDAIVAATTVAELDYVIDVAMKGTP